MCPSLAPVRPRPRPWGSSAGVPGGCVALAVRTGCEVGVPLHGHVMQDTLWGCRTGGLDPPRPCLAVTAAAACPACCSRPRCRGAGYGHGGRAHQTQTPKCRRVPAPAPHEDGGVPARAPAGPGGCHVGLPGSCCHRGALIAAGSRLARGFVPRRQGCRVAPLMGKLMSCGARGRWWQPSSESLPLPAAGAGELPDPPPLWAPHRPLSCLGFPKQPALGGRRAPAGSAQMGFP